MSEEKNKNKYEQKTQFDKMKERFANKTPKGGKNDGRKPFNFYWIYAIIGVILISINLFSWNSGAKQTNWKKFNNEMLMAHDVDKIVVVNNELIAEIYIQHDKLEKDQYKEVRNTPFGNEMSTGPHFYMNIGSIESFEDKLAKAQENFTEEERVSVTYDPRKNWGGELLGWLIPIGLMIALWVFIMRRMSGGGGPGGQIFNIGKSKANLYDKNTNIKITFGDVAGLEGAKEEVMEIVDFLKNPKRYTALGAKIPKGALLVGPPGTGKTLLAKAVAGEAQVPFFSLSGSDFVEMFVGVGASRVRDLFKQAKEKAPCIIFIDEIDAIGRARGKNVSQGANDERENTLNQLLTEMDGFGTNTGVILLAATNRADILDRALLRPGRFDRQIYVDMPDLNERRDIFKVHLKPLKLDKSIDVEFLAKQTPGFSGADIANICNEAALIAARKNKKQIEKQDFLDAVDRVIAGLEKKNKIITEEEKKVIAYHEAGHASVSWLLEHASPLVKVTIVPRGKSLGAAWYLPEERQITTTEQMMDEICAALGGRAAEEVVFGKISTGALSDLEKITKQAYAMVSIYGLNEKIGNISYYDSSGQDYGFTKPYSEQTAQLIDQEVNKLIEEAYAKTKKLITENREKVNALAELLLEKEVIFKEDMVNIFGKRPWKTTEEKNMDYEESKKKQAEATKVKEIIDQTPPVSKETLAEEPQTNNKSEEEKESSPSIETNLEIDTEKNQEQQNT